ncbi:hypothetical protein [Thiocystis minor]|uniref:hypothetical protein n=1 Tax=Thiocystis minor TaxID=61597 RepID=UPI001F5DCBE4|nr:hypothetical protein [Thiocystis minor]
MVSLINDLRPDLPEIRSVEILNPGINAEELRGKYIIELKKADRLGLGSDPLSAWITFFEHWREEQTMAAIEHTPIQEVLNRMRQLSADEEARRLAFVRERALHDEVSLLKEAREEGEQIGMRKGRLEGRLEAAQDTARNLIALGVLSDGQIAQVTGLRVAQIEALRSADRNETPR